jgi:hypothetical protein
LKRHVGISDAGVIREINFPEEADYLELIEFSDEIERLLIFEDFLKLAKKKITRWHQYYLSTSITR